MYFFFTIALWEPCCSNSLSGHDTHQINPDKALERANQQLQTEIANRWQTTAALNRAHQQLTFHIENSPLAVIEWDSNQRVQYWSHQAEEIFGWRADELMGKQWSDWQFVFEADRDRVQKCCIGLFNGDVPRNVCDNRNYTKSGDVRACRWHNSVLLDNDGQPISILSLILDLTERKQAEAALELRQFCIDRATESIFWVTPDGRFHDVNQSACTVLGYTREELLSLTVFAVNSDLSPTTWNHYWQQLRQQRSATFEANHATKEGHLLPVEVSVSYLEFEGQEYAFVFARDITERRQAEAALKQSQERLDSILQSLDDAVWSMSVHTGRLLYINPAVERVYGRPAQEFFSDFRLWMDIIHPDDRDRIEQAALSLLEQGLAQPDYVQDLEYRIFWPSGEVRWVRERSRLIGDADGTPLRIDGLTTDITQRKQIVLALRQSEERLRTIIETNSDGLVVVNASGAIEFVNPAAEKLFGRATKDLLGHWLGNLYVVNELAEISILKPTGEVVIAEMRVVEIFWEEGIAYLASLRDITQRQQAEDALAKSEEQFRLIFELAPTGMAIATPDGRFLRANHAFCRILDYTPQEILTRSFADITHAEDLSGFQELSKTLLRGSISNFESEIRCLTKEGEVVNAILQMALIRDVAGDPVNCISQIVDISDRKRAEEQLRYNAFYDNLTNLPNRALFMDRLSRALRRSKRYPDYLFAVLFVDLDRFKVINDSLGHVVGDQLLVAIARRLESCLRSIDTVARLGGDEFTILLDDIAGIEDSISVAEKLQQVLKPPFLLEGEEIVVSASIGIATNLFDYEEEADLLRDADIAMYRAKELGRAGHSIFAKAMHDRALGRLQLETALRRALERQEFCVYYQPIVSLQSGTLAGFEALIRWRHPERGLVPPGEFIPLAEETGLIVPIGAWVLQESCRQLQAWQQQFPDRQRLTVSVNLSGRQFSQPDLLEEIDRTLRVTQLSSRCLKLEITESVLIDDPEAAIAILEALRSRQIQLCIDDFGTGYSSLSYLHRFPANTLKIDRSFVSGIATKEEDREIIRTIVALAHNLQMDTIAEGVEAHPQLHCLKELQCEQGQGYLFGKALDAIAAESLIARSPQWF